MANLISGHDHGAAFNSTDAAWAAHVADYEGARSLLRAKAQECSERHAQLEARKAALAEKNGGSAVKGTDKLKLNVGGTRVTVRRETLTQLPTTRLAALFSGRWETRLLRDKKKRIFLDVNSTCFKKIVDFHNLMKIADPEDPPGLPEVASEDQVTFSRLCDFFGLTEALATDPGRRLNKQSKCEPKAGSEWNTCSLDGFVPAITKALQAERDSLRQADTELVELENKFDEEEAFIDFFVGGETKDIVELDVSGEKMAVKRSTLMLCKESALARQFDDVVWAKQEASEASDSEDESVMIEQSAYCFGKIVDQLRLRAIAMPGEELPPTPALVEHERKNFERVVTYYFPGVEAFIFTKPRVDSIILSADQCTQVCAWLPQGSVLPFELLFRASRDGWSAAEFHGKCDNKGATITVVKSTGGYIFGGFADQPWTSRGSWVTSSQAFLFALHCHSGLGPTKMPLTGGQSGNAMYDKVSHGPTFGGGHDLLVATNANVGTNSYIRLGQAGSYQGPSYQCPPFLTGARNYQAVEVEVFRVL